MNRWMKNKDNSKSTITAVKKQKGTYLLKDFGLLAKLRGIEVTPDGYVDAIFVFSNAPSSYLRPKAMIKAKA